MKGWEKCIGSLEKSSPRRHPVFFFKGRIRWERRQADPSKMQMDRTEDGVWEPEWKEEQIQRRPTPPLFPRVLSESRGEGFEKRRREVRWLRDNPVMRYSKELVEGEVEEWEYGLDMK